MKLSSFQRGQGMTEYIIIVTLIAIAAIGVYRYIELNPERVNMVKELSEYLWST